MEEKKESFFVKFSKYIKYTILIIFPSFKILSFNKLLKRSSIITKDPWFKKQIKKNYIIAIILLLPIILGYLKISNLYHNDTEFKNRIMIASKQEKFFDRIPSYYKTIVLDDSDSAELVSKKIETQIRMVAIGIVLIMIISIQIFLALIISNYHPVFVKTEKLTKLLIANGIIKKEDVNQSIVFATPIGFLITITGSSAKEIAYMDRIWAGLNLKIKDWIEDEEERSVVFFRKAFELQSSYMYDKFPSKK